MNAEKRVKRFLDEQCSPILDGAKKEMEAYDRWLHGDASDEIYVEDQHACYLRVLEEVRRSMIANAIDGTYGCLGDQHFGIAVALLEQARCHLDLAIVQRRREVATPHPITRKGL